MVNNENQSQEKSYKGINRVVYLILFVSLTIFITALIKNAQNVIGSPIRFQPIFHLTAPAYLVLTYFRLKNMGVSGWVTIFLLIPILNASLIIACLICPAGSFDKAELSLAKRIGRYFLVLAAGAICTVFIKFWFLDVMRAKWPLIMQQATSSEGAGSEWNRINSEVVELLRQGNYTRAMPVAKRALELAEKNVGPEHPDLATSLNNLAGLHNEQGQYAQAEPLYQRALAIQEKTLGLNHPSVGTTLSNLAGIYYTQGQYAQAEPLFKRSLTIKEKAFGPDHPDVAISLNGLAVLYGTQGKYAQAEPLFHRALSIQEKTLGLDHPDVASSLSSLARLYYTQGQYTQAEPLCKRSLAIQEKILGSNHPYVATSLENLAALYSQMGRQQQALALEKRAADIRAMQ